MIAHSKHPGPIRWLPRQGAPRARLEAAAQRAVKLASCVPIYTAVIVTLILVVQVFWGR